MKELEVASWIMEFFPQHQMFIDKDNLCAWSNDYSEIFLYFGEISFEPMIRIVNVEMINETLFVCQIPETKDEFIQLMNLTGFQLF